MDLIAAISSGPVAIDSAISFTLSNDIPGICPCSDRFSSASIAVCCRRSRQLEAYL